jgi:hypothetical protein
MKKLFGKSKYINLLSRIQSIGLIAVKGAVMLAFRIIISFVVTLATLLYAIPSNSREVIEDSVDIEQVGRKIIAIRDGSQTTPLELRLKEEVLWLDSDGYVGALLTNERFIAISLFSSWLQTPLRSKEAYDGNPILSPTLALLLTKERVIGFDAISPRFIEQSRRLDEEFVAAEANDYVAVVISSVRALGLAAGGGGFREIRFRISETVQSIRTKSRVVTVRTSWRILTFSASSSSWSEVGL